MSQWGFSPEQKTHSEKKWCNQSRFKTVIRGMLIDIKNKFAASDKVILMRLNDQSHSLTGFNEYVTSGVVGNFLLWER